MYGKRFKKGTKSKKAYDVLMFDLEALVKGLDNLLYYTIYVFITIFVNLGFAFIMVWAWNKCMPLLFGLPTINWIQAFALMIVVSVLLPHKIITRG